MGVMSELHTTGYGDHGSHVVLCHGLFGQGRNWTQIARELGHAHRVLLVDMPNHGRSVWTEEFSYVDMADRVARVLPTDGPVTLVGHSMGGKAAMLVALRHPGLVERLCVVDVSPTAYDHASEFAGYIASMRELDLERLGSRGEADEAMADAVPDLVIRGFLLQNLRREGDRWRWQVNLRLLGDHLADVAGWPAEQVDGARYDGPVLWVNGESSGYVREEHSPAMDALFPRNRRVTVKNAGHWVHSEQPKVFVELLRHFIAG
jgi:pimeloyl-ACP methyl ester carboxylesterase